MDPQHLEAVLKIITNYGLGVVSFVVLILVVRWVFKSSDKREASMTLVIDGSLKTLTNAMAQNTQQTIEIARNMKDGFDLIVKANDYHRADLKEIAGKVEKACKHMGGVA